MTKNSKNILYINLTQQDYQLRTYNDLNPFIGGIGLGLKLFSDNKEKNPVIFSCGPLSGVFPFASKTCVLYTDKTSNLKEAYGGGGFASKLRILGIDAIIIYGKLKNGNFILVEQNKVTFIHLKDEDKITQFGMAGRKSTLYFGRKVGIDKYFSFGDAYLNIPNLSALTISGDGEIIIPNPKEYWEIYTKILEKKYNLAVQYSSYPSCFGCPAGCEFSKEGEERKIATLARCLVSCQFAEEIYKDISLVFSCLTVLGYKYNHEDLENVSDLVGDLRREVAESV